MASLLDDIQRRGLYCDEDGSPGPCWEATHCRLLPPGSVSLVYSSDSLKMMMASKCVSEKFVASYTPPSSCSSAICLESAAPVYCWTEVWLAGQHRFGKALSPAVIRTTHNAAHESSDDRHSAFRRLFHGSRNASFPS